MPMVQCTSSAMFVTCAAAKFLCFETTCVGLITPNRNIAQCDTRATLLFWDRSGTSLGPCVFGEDVSGHMSGLISRGQT